MSAWLAAQYAVVAVAVLASAMVVMRKQFPGTTRWLRTRMAIWLLRDGRPQALRLLGRRVAPPTTAGTTGCAGCSSCEPGESRN